MMTTTITPTTLLELLDDLRDRDGIKVHSC
jgi:hypothetical protein